MKNSLRNILIVILSLLAVYLLMCAYFTHKVKVLTETSHGFFPYEKSSFLTEQQYHELSPYVLIDMGVSRGDIQWKKNDDDQSSVATYRLVTYDFTGISYAYFDFSSASFIVRTPFDFSAEYSDGSNTATMDGHCNRQVRIIMDTGFWRIGEISSDYEV